MRMEPRGPPTSSIIPTCEGWLYLAVILDLCSRLAVGWAMSERITDDLTAGGDDQRVQVELVHAAAWATRATARTELVECLELFYNGQRRHSALGYLSSRAFERQREQDALATQPTCR